MGGTRCLPGAASTMFPVHFGSFAEAVARRRYDGGLFIPPGCSGAGLDPEFDAGAGNLLRVTGGGGRAGLGL